MKKKIQITEQEKRNYLFLQGFYLKVKFELERLEKNLNIKEDRHD